VLAFLPRAAAIFMVFALIFPWMLRVLTGFTQQLFARLPELIR
jgi:flagellar biosynthesis protein FliQ